MGNAAFGVAVGPGADAEGITGTVGAGVVNSAGGAAVVTAAVTGCVNCEREKPYTADASTTAITEPSPLTATERALIGSLAVKEPSFVPARS